MRTWRDVISEFGWRTGVLERADKTTATMGNVARLRSKFQDRFSSPVAFLDHIGEKLHQYHKIKKDELGTIETRIKALKELSELACKYLSTFKVDLAAAAVRNDSNNKHKIWNRHTTGTPQDESVDRNVLTLARRSLRKAGYLKTLRSYYAKGGAGHQFLSAQSLLDYVKQPQEKTVDYVGLSPGVRMEQLDPVHRGDYETDDEGSISCGAAFAQWVKAASLTPFFLWLENHWVSIEDNKGKFETNSVAYVRADKHQQADARSKLALLDMSNPIRTIDLTVAGMPPRPCDTVADGYKSEARKDPRGDKTWGVGVAAFAWTQPGEIFIANHLAQEFHHSSFISGQRVRCAGMIIIEKGKVTGLNNNSGHYKPRKEHVRNMVLSLQNKGNLDANAVIEVHLGAKRYWRGIPARFLRDFAQLENLAVVG